MAKIVKKVGSNFVFFLPMGSYGYRIAQYSSNCNRLSCITWTVKRPFNSIKSSHFSFILKLIHEPEISINFKSYRNVYKSLLKQNHLTSTCNWMVGNTYLLLVYCRDAMHILVGTWSCRHATKLQFETSFLPFKMHVTFKITNAGVSVGVEE